MSVIDDAAAVVPAAHRLHTLAVLAEHGQRLDAEVVAADKQRLDLLDNRVLRQVQRLGNPTAQEGLHRAHHVEVPVRLDGQRAVSQWAGQLTPYKASICQRAKSNYRRNL